MLKFKRKLLYPLLLSVLATPAFAESGKSTDKKVVASINGKNVYAQELIMTAEQNKIDYSILNDQQKSQLLNGLINRIIVASEAKKHKLDKDADIKLRLEALKDSVLAAAMLEKKTQEIKVSDTDIKKYYEEKITTQHQKEYKARHILVEEEKDAKKIVKDIRAGKDFGALAQEKSKDKGSAVKGGDLGWFNPQAMVPSFAEAVKKATKGKVTDPVKSQFGWHVILVDDSKDIAPPSLEDSKEQIRQMMTKEKISAYLDGLRTKYKIVNKFEK